MKLYELNDNSLNGNIFECLLLTILYRSGIAPIFVKAELAFVPNVRFDFVVYSKEKGSIVLSAKTSLRERYKQADLEGTMLRQVHRKAESYLLTLNEKEAPSVNTKIAKSQVLGLDKVGTSKNYDFVDVLALFRVWVVVRADIHGKY